MMKKSSVVVIVQARVGSTRLPRKVLRPLAGKPMLERELERIKKAKRIDAFVLATTQKPEDDVIVEIAKRAGFACFRGSESDVLDRYYQAAKGAKAEVIVRVTGDCPLHDPEVVDLVVDRFLEKGVDYAKTPENYPEGLDTEVFSFAALETAWKEAKLPSEREHVTPFIRNHPDRFRIDVPWKSGDPDHAHYHWSVDTEQDLRFVEAIYEHFGSDTLFHMNDILSLLAEKPELSDINRGGTGYEGLAKSLREDEEFKNHHE